MYEATGDYLNYLDPIITYSYEIQSKNKPTKKWYDEIPTSQLNRSFKSFIVSKLALSGLAG